MCWFRFLLPGPDVAVLYVFNAGGILLTGSIPLTIHVRRDTAAPRSGDML